MITWMTSLLFTLLIIPISGFSYQYTIEGKVVAITDGDTIKVKTLHNKVKKIRLAQIDTPEKKQPYGSKAKQALSNKIYGKKVKINIVTTDRYGRLVGTVWYNDKDINRSMVRGGHAWVYRKYVTDKTLFDDESYARSQGLGLWSLPENQRQAPWKWRKSKRKKGIVKLSDPNQLARKI